MKSNRNDSAFPKHVSGGDHGMTWDGRVSIYLFEKELFEKKFDCQTLEELRKEVETYIESIRLKVESLFINFQ